MNRRAAGFAAVLVALAIGHARLLSRSALELVGIVPDDAFYYFQMARQMAAGHGSTFDGVHVTTGYHPVWMALLAALAAVLRQPMLLLRGALALEFLLHAAAAVALIGLFRRFMSPGLAVIGGLCWLANPFALYISLQGLESAAYVFSLVLVLRATARFVEGPGTLAPHLLLGGALGLCFLSRTEGGLLAAVTCLVAPALRGTPPWSRPGLRSVFLIGATFTLCAIPWFIYCWLIAGTPWQSTGAIKALWAKELLGPLSAAGRLARVGDVLGHIWLVAPWMGTWEWPKDGIGINPFVCVAMAPAAVGLLLAVRRPLEDRRLIAWSAWLLGSTVVTGAVYGLIYWDSPIWYRTQPAFLLFVITYLWIARTAAMLAGSRWGVIFATGVPLLLLALSLITVFSFYRDPPVAYPWQQDVYRSQSRFEKLVPAGEAIACFNAGIPGYFGGRRIVNVDGLVNNSVVPYYRAGHLERYFSDEHIHYIADDRGSLEHATQFMSRPLRLNPLASAPLEGWFSPRRFLWEVE